VGVDKHVVLADRSEAYANAPAEVVADAGYQVGVATVDVSSREAVRALVGKATGIGEIVGLIHAAGVTRRSLRHRSGARGIRERDGPAVGPAWSSRRTLANSYPRSPSIRTRRWR
jgi:hypothetical protein